MSKAPTTSTERLDALRRCCETYGADARRWPETMRAEFAGLAGDDEAAEMIAEAQMLDGFLNAASAPTMSEDLTRRIMANFSPARAKAGLLDLLRGLAPSVRLLPAGALAGIGALGLASGMMTASAQSPLTPETEALAYLDALSVTALDDGEELTWDAE
jgi:hypothetical protein